jgi:UDP-N-acetylmuramoyl-tripeptide--D-alanyl-D-alanine ligase
VRTRSLAEIAKVVGGTIIPSDARSLLAKGAAVDSREVAAGDLFFALVGERSDGHAHVRDALLQGGVGAVVGDGRLAGEIPGPLVMVRDPARALLALAAEERSGLSARVVGITGSTGKTCAKDFTAAVLGRTMDVVASKASFNNEVGLPLTILRADERTEALVLEMGSRGPGHIRLLCDVARPHVGAVTNVGVAHMELFGSASVLHDAKAELPESLPEAPEGTAVLNADDAVVRSYEARTRARVLMFGTGPGAEIRAERIVVSRESGRAAFDLVAAGGVARVTLTAPGEHLVSDALAAAAIGVVLGVPLPEIADGLATATLSGGRMEVFRTSDGVRVVNDAYNANPASMAAGLRAAKWMAGSGRAFAVLGEMAELGPIAAQEHERIGELLARLGIDGLIAVGPEARLIAVGAEREGVEPERIVACDTAEEAIAAVREMAGPGDLVLVKASRVVRLERVAEALRDPAHALGGASA